jgi:hypothetical protein
MQVRPFHYKYFRVCLNGLWAYTIKHEGFIFCNISYCCALTLKLATNNK